MGSPRKEQTTRVFNLLIEVQNPTADFYKELEKAAEMQNIIYIDRFVYGIPEMVMEGPDGTLSICLLPVPELLDPWAITQDLKDELEEADNNGEFSDDPLE